MKKVSFIIDKNMTEVTSATESIINEKLQGTGISYAGRNEAENSFSFAVQTASISDKLKMVILSNDESSRIEYYFSIADSCLPAIKKFNSLLVDMLNASLTEELVASSDSEGQDTPADTKQTAEKTGSAQSAVSAIQSSRIENVQETDFKHKLPKILKIEAIVILACGIIAAIALSVSETTTISDYSYILDDFTYDTVTSFNSTTFLSYLITYIVYSSVIYGIGEILDTALKNNDLLKKKENK